MGNEDREHFEVAFLGAQHRLLAVERLFSGTVDGAHVSPRIVIQGALALNAAAIILAHNHPGGSPEPSAADKAIPKHGCHRPCDAGAGCRNWLYRIGRYTLEPLPLE
ncbi:JAB domain-containing protein [Stenotrophomonas geniculata]|uniref:JAB domain-containing protein n=1 Tax=Stenotrophomonas geniculata TaxID=86188 RepID=UPI0030CD836A